MYFIALYDSEDPVRRKVAIIMLAMATCLKGYPALFGLLYVRKRMYRELFYAAGISILLAFLPFLFFKNGFNNIPKWLSNTFLNSQVYSNPANGTARFDVNYLIYYFLNLIKCTNSHMLITLPSIGGMLLKILAVFALVASLFIKSEYISMVLIALGIMFLPANSGLYCGVYLFPAIILLFSIEAQDKGFKLYHAMFYLFYLSPLQYYIYHNQRKIIISWYIINIATILFLIVMLVFCVFSLRKAKNALKKRG